MTERWFLDTNVLLYAISLAPGEAVKRQRAQELIDAGPAALSVQVFHEFIAQSTHYRRDPPLSINDAWKFVTLWRRFPVQENTLAVLDNAYEIQLRHRFSFWDSLIIAAAQALGCDTLYTEDMDHGRIIGRLKIVNPFL